MNLEDNDYLGGSVRITVVTDLHGGNDSRVINQINKFIYEHYGGEKRRRSLSSAKEQFVKSSEYSLGITFPSDLGVLAEEVDNNCFSEESNPDKEIKVFLGDLNYPESIRGVYEEIVNNSKSAFFIPGNHDVSMIAGKSGVYSMPLGIFGMNLGDLLRGICKRSEPISWLHDPESLIMLKELFLKFIDDAHENKGNKESTLFDKVLNFFKKDKNPYESTNNEINNHSDEKLHSINYGHIYSKTSIRSLKDILGKIRKEVGNQYFERGLLPFSLKLSSMLGPEDKEAIGPIADYISFVHGGLTLSKKESKQLGLCSIDYKYGSIIANGNVISNGNLGRYSPLLISSNRREKKIDQLLRSILEYYDANSTWYRAINHNRLLNLGKVAAYKGVRVLVRGHDHFSGLYKIKDPLGDNPQLFYFNPRENDWSLLIKGLRNSQGEFTNLFDMGAYIDVKELYNEANPGTHDGAGDNNQKMVLASYPVELPFTIKNNGGLRANDNRPDEVYIISSGAAFNREFSTLQVDRVGPNDYKLKICFHALMNKP